MRSVQKPGKQQGSLSVVEAERNGGERSEPERSSASTTAAPEPRTASRPPDPEVSADRPRRRTFTADYKKRILEEADACTEPGGIGELLRREGLYSSHLAEWRKQRDAAVDGALAPKKRGRKPFRDESAERIRQLERENHRLQERLRKAEIIIDVQKKISQLLGIPLKTPEDGENE